MKLFTFLIGGLLTLSSVLSTAVVEKIEVKCPTEQTVSQDLVLSRMKLYVGSQFNNELLSDDIKSLYGSGFFSDVTCDVSNGDSGVVLTVNVVPQPSIRQVVFKGNEEFDDEDLLDEVSLQSGDLLNIKTLATDKKAILALYEDKSYFGTTVQAKTEELLDGQVDIRWRIKEQPRYKVGDVTFSGNEFFDEGDLEDSIITEHSWLSWIFPMGYINQDAFPEDKRMIVRKYRDAGFLDTKVAGMKTTPDDSYMDVNFTIVEGERYKVGDIFITGCEKLNEDEIFSRYKKTMEKRRIQAFERGEWFDGEREKQFIEFIKSQYFVDGYLEMRCRPDYKKLGKDGERYVNIELVITEGTQSSIRNVNIRGNRVTQDKVIRRELDLLPGDLANRRKIDASKRRLQNLNYFDIVDVIPVATERDDEKDLDITVREKGTGQLQLGAGFSTEDSVIGSIEVSQANFDYKNYPYFRGAGQKMRLRLQAGSETSEFLASFTEPWLNNRPLSLTGSAYLRDRQYDEYDQKTIGTNWSVTKKMKLRYWRSTTGLSLERIDISDVEDDASDELKAEEDTYNVFKIYQQWSRNSTDRFRFPTRGSKFSARVGLQAEALGSYNTAAKLKLSYDKYFPLTPESDWVVRIGTKFYQMSKIEGDDPAIFDRFFAGGPRTIRGFDYRDVGPVDSNEDPIGGESLFTLTAELRVPIIDSIHFVTFCDAGNVWEDAWEIDPSEFNASVGFGFRFDMAIPITVDYGIPVHTDQPHLEDENGRLHFNIGASF